MSELGDGDDLEETTSHREPTPLEKNRALEEWLRYQLGQVQARIRELEVQEAEERRRRQQAYAGLHWKIQPQRSNEAALLHRGDCGTYPVQGGFIGRDDAVIALSMPEVEPCPICRPETGLAQG
ncbi:DUF6233 domain-containing protein [Streptomyces sp. CS090A]|uniref:DUF6233 domain-containing protein n=1 Tax=Streptomyces sp. CS090A TaxID=2162710 RepID=UPI001EF667DD|nr:DUF6233 domain-containing protein [Streptomyces sp. CS090A]